jgi:hypothetical protein
MDLELARWVDTVFGGADPADPGNIDRLDNICRPDEPTLLKLIDVFGNPRMYLSAITDKVLDRAFWDLDYMALPILFDSVIDFQLRRRLISTFEILFRELFAERCKPVLGHQAKEYEALNGICYMWWDFNYLLDYRAWELNPCDPVCLESMRSILTIGNSACQESALHGLGHWHKRHDPSLQPTVESMIDEFLRDTPGLSADLREYALAARRGAVL